MEVFVTWGDSKPDDHLDFPQKEQEKAAQGRICESKHDKSWGDKLWRGWNSSCFSGLDCASLASSSISPCLAVWTASNSNLLFWPLLIKWCFLSPLGCRPSVCLSLLLSVSPSVCLYQKSRRFKTKREGTDYGNRPIKLAGKVIIQEISCLLPVHKALGESYMWEKLRNIILLWCFHTSASLVKKIVYSLSCVSVWTWTTSRKRVRRTRRRPSQSDAEMSQRSGL